MFILKSMQSLAGNSLHASFSYRVLFLSPSLSPMAAPSSRFFSLVSSLLFTISLLNNHPTTSLAQTLFVFGDGFYDVGNKQFLTGKLVPANAHPYGVAIHSATGRWSDGLVVPDYLAGFMGIHGIPPILDQKADFSHGASFAVADATVLGSRPASMNLKEQVMKLFENKKKWTDKERSEAIYLFYIGGEDYFNYAKNNPNPSSAQKLALVDQVIMAIDETIKEVYEAGGRKFAFQNLAPLGCLPIAKQEMGNGDKCVKLPSELAALHNEKLLQLLNRLAQDLEGFRFSFYDFFGSLHQRVGLPLTYAFRTGDTACCGIGPYNGSGCTAETLCAEPGSHVFFDGKHLTQAASSQVAHLMWGATSEIVGPLNLRELIGLPLDIPVKLTSKMITGAVGAAGGDEESMSMMKKIYGMSTLEVGSDEGTGSFIM